MASRMTPLAWLEKRFGRFAVPNLTLLIIIGQVATFLLAYSQRQAGQGMPLLGNMMLVPRLVMEGEVWRIFTFALSPPSLNVLWAFFAWYLFYLMGTTLESTWGAFRYNAFLGIGYVATVAASFAASFVTPNLPAENAFLYGSVFLAFARMFPNFVLHLMMILPIKIKWLALIAWLGYGFAFMGGTMSTRLMIVASVLNYLLFFGKGHYRDLKDRQRRRAFVAKTAPKTKSGRMEHTCTSCGLTSEKATKIAFRYCSKCAGQACYCPDHIRDHEHTTAENE